MICGKEKNTKNTPIFVIFLSRMLRTQYRAYIKWGW
jgi:hypothetical protein